MSTFSMTKLRGRGSWTLLSLMFMSIVILAWCAPASADELKDIRVGEYKGFTRIVFELDEPAAQPDLKIQSSNHLLVTFSKTKPNLIRHIPVERSPHVAEIQLWQHKAALSTLLIFDYPHIRIESFRLSRPPRFAVDVFSAANPVMEKTATPESQAKTVSSGGKKERLEGLSNQFPLAKDAPSEPTIDQGAAITVTSDMSTRPKEIEEAAPLADPKQMLDEKNDKPSTNEQNAPSVVETDKSIPSEQKEEKDHSTKPSNRIDRGQRDASQQVEPSPALPANHDMPETSAETAQSAKQPSPPSESIGDVGRKDDNTVQVTPSSKSRLQFYLVIILVIITIAILLLLLLMLLSRHRLFYDKDAFRAAEISQHQDKNTIAELDSNIKKQLKRYDEA